uniref:Uncharacterized protein n=1 Tax=Arundo donax TaxID=35708 RepID=A0A0A8ZH58_ARUDO
MIGHSWSLLDVRPVATAQPMQQWPMCHLLTATGNSRSPSLGMCLQSRDLIHPSTSSQPASTHAAA